MKKKFSRTLEGTRFSGAPIVAVAALPGGVDSKCPSQGVDKLVQVKVLY